MWGEGVYFAYTFTEQSTIKVRQDRDLEAEAEAKVMESDDYQVAPHHFQDLLVRSGTTHSGQDNPTSITDEENGPQTCPQANLREVFFLTNSPPPQVTLAYMELT